MSYFGKGGSRGSNGDGPSDGDPATCFAMLAQVRAYWEGLRQGTDLPRRDEIDPRGIAGALENTFLLERVAPGVARFRLAGMQLHDLMGMDVRGMPLTALIDPAGRARISEHLETVFASPAILQVWLDAERGLGRPALDARMLLLPLTSQRGTVDLALGCLAVHGALGRAPRRFAIASLVTEKIERRATQRRIAPRQEDERREPVPLAPLAGMAEMALTYTPAFPPRPPRGKPHLRLVHSRD
jgi:hypothetical protein